MVDAGKNRAASAGQPGLEAPGVHFSPLVAIQLGSTQPFFCVHGAGGNVLNFRDIARRLGSAQTFYGLQARGVDGSPTLNSVEEMAEAYLTALFEVQPRGPYWVGGYSSGGIVAFEMARRLREAGHDVPLLALLDTFGPGVRPLPTSLEQHARRLLSEGPRYLGQTLRRKFKSRTDGLTTALKIRFYERHQQPLPLELREQRLAQAALSAASRYRPQVYSGRAILYRAAEVDPPFLHVGAKRGWDALLPNLEVVEVPGTHASFVYEPSVDTMTRHLAAALRGAVSS